MAVDNSTWARFAVMSMTLAPVVKGPSSSRVVYNTSTCNFESMANFGNRYLYVSGWCEALGDQSQNDHRGSF